MFGARKKQAQKVEQEKMEKRVRLAAVSAEAAHAKADRANDAMQMLGKRFDQELGAEFAADHSPASGARTALDALRSLAADAERRLNLLRAEIKQDRAERKQQQDKQTQNDDKRLEVLDEAERRIGDERQIIMQRVNTREEQEAFQRELERLREEHEREAVNAIRTAVRQASTKIEKIEI